MIEGMREVVPDVNIIVNVVATTCWSKQAEAVYDAQGRLIPWSPPAEPASNLTVDAA
jgi:hypothetical protein